MTRFPDFPTDLILADDAPAPEEAKDSAEAAPVEAGTETAGSESVETTTATTEAPVERTVEGVLEPISGSMITWLVLFGIGAAIMIVAMTRFGSSNDYGD